jgi:hypothetical protein
LCTPGPFTACSWCSGALAMPSLLSPPAKPAKTMPAQHLPPSKKYREVEYHLDGNHRYVAQSYEVRPPSCSSSVTSSPRTQPTQSTRHSNLSEPSAPAKFSSTKFEQSKMVVVQSREDALQGSPCDNARTAKVSTLEDPPPAPRPRRLSSPDLPDVKSDQSFCHCDTN